MPGNPRAAEDGQCCARRPDAPRVAERIDQVRHCMSGVRAEPYAFGSDELTALELVLMQRAAGMPVESPAVQP